MFPHPVRLRPTIGEAPQKMIRDGGLKRYRPIAIAFPGFPYPEQQIIFKLLFLETILRMINTTLCA